MTHTCQQVKADSITLIMHVRTTEYYFFLFSLKNKDDYHVMCHSFIFLRKSINEMKNIFHNNLWTPLISDFEEVPILKNAHEKEMVVFERIH